MPLFSSLSPSPIPLLLSLLPSYLHQNEDIEGVVVLAERLGDEACFVFEF